MFLFKRLFLALLAAHTAFLYGKPQQELNSVLAAVNGKPITLNDILPHTRNREYRAHASCSGKELEQQILAIRKEAVDLLIDRELILADYAVQKFEITHRDIENGMDETAERMGIRSRSEFAAKLRQQGSSIEEMRQQVKEHMAVQLMLYRQYSLLPPPSPEMIYNYYRKHYADKQSSAEIELAMIMLKKENSALIREVAEKLARDPENFAALAKEHSVGPGRDEGGRLGVIPQDLLRKEFAAVLKNPEKEKVYGPVETPEGTVFLRVLSLKLPQKTSLREASAEIKALLEQKLREESRKTYTGRLRQNAIIRYFF